MDVSHVRFLILIFIYVYEEIMDVLEDMELAAIVESRKGQPTIKVDINDL